MFALDSGSDPTQLAVEKRHDGWYKNDKGSQPVSVERATWDRGKSTGNALWLGLYIWAVICKWLTCGVTMMVRSRMRRGGRGERKKGLSGRVGARC